MLLITLQFFSIYLTLPFFLFFSLFSALFYSLDAFLIFHYSIFPLPSLAQTLSRIISSPLLSLSLAPFSQHPFRNLSRCTFHFTPFFSFFSFLFRFLTSHYLLSSLQPLGHETHVSEIPRYEGPSN